MGNNSTLFILNKVFTQEMLNGLISIRNNQILNGVHLAFYEDNDTHISD